MKGKISIHLLEQSYRYGFLRNETFLVDEKFVLVQSSNPRLAPVWDGTRRLAIDSVRQVDRQLEVHGNERDPDFLGYCCAVLPKTIFTLPTSLVSCELFILIKQERGTRG